MVVMVVTVVTVEAAVSGGAVDNSVEALVVLKDSTAIITLREKVPESVFRRVLVRDTSD